LPVQDATNATSDVGVISGKHDIEIIRLSKSSLLHFKFSHQTESILQNITTSSYKCLGGPVKKYVTVKVYL